MPVCRGNRSVDSAVSRARHAHSLSYAGSKPATRAADPIIVAVRECRGADVIAVYSTDRDWRIVIETGEPTLYKRDVDSEMIESLPLADGRVEELAAKQGTLADLFPAAARVA